MAFVDPVPSGLRLSQTPQQRTKLVKRMNDVLLKIIRANLNTQYGSQAPLLEKFRDAVSMHGGTDIDATLLADFRTQVPLSSYDPYKPFIDKFNAQPCREQDVENMFCPGLPDFLALSSATSGTTAKMLPKYKHSTGADVRAHPLFDPDGQDLLAALVCTACREIKTIECAPGQLARKIPVCPVTGGGLRRLLELLTDDESQMSLNFPGYVVPWAATLIGHLPSFLIIHGLFFLSRKEVKGFYVTFATNFVDLIRHIDEQWEVLLVCIRDGKLPDVEGIEDVREYLQAQFSADPERAVELREIGPPFSFDGWFNRVWPHASTLITICSGPFASVLPTVKSVLGPNVTVSCPGYGSSEAMIGSPHVGKLDEFVLRMEEVVEFLDVSREETQEDICQAWEVEVGKQYEPILTTRDGLWRYQLGDIIQIIGFDAEGNSPVFKYLGRKSLTMRLFHVQITDYHLLEAFRDFQLKSTIQVQEFTTMIDDRALPPTVGFIFELVEPLRQDACLPQKLFNALVSTNVDHQRALEHGLIRLPTVRLVKPGTFAEYRQWRCESVNIASGQIKVPLVLVDPTVQAWFLKRVIQEL